MSGEKNEMLPSDKGSLEAEDVWRTKFSEQM